ncbi:MAG: 50S ribosomal protein L21 [Candidatus Buchananbacteria bacterium]
MKLAVIKTGGKQYIVKEKDKIKVEKLKAEKGAKVELDVLMVVDGDNIDFGAPVMDRKVEGLVLSEGRTRKVTGVKFKSKTREHKTFGHRQIFTEVEIAKI